MKSEVLQSSKQELRNKRIYFWENNDNKKAAKLLKREIYTELLLFLLSFDKKIKKELTKGKNINVDKIGKFILI